MLLSYPLDKTLFGISCGRQKPPKRILLPYVVKSLTNNVDLIQLLNRCVHGIAYSQLTELNTALCLQKMATTTINAVPLPENIRSFIPTSLGWDNIDHLEETLSGEGTSHRVNGIAVQANHYGPHLPTAQVPKITKSKREVLNHVMIQIFLSTMLVSDVGQNQDSTLRLHTSERQIVPGWTGFNIHEVINNLLKENEGYLPTVNAPATNMSTVFQVLLKSNQIKETLRLRSLVLVFDQALYAKAFEIKWKH